MAVLGSTVDPRLGAVSPAAIQALSQAGAATGQMYANLGSSIAGVIQDAKSKRDDEALKQAYLDNLQIDKDGNQKVDRKGFLEDVKNNKVSSELANAYLNNQLEISSTQNQMDIQNKMAGYEGERVQLEGEKIGLEGRRVGVAEKTENRLGTLQTHQINLGNRELNIKAYEALSDSYSRVAQLKLQKDQLAQDKGFNEKEFNRKVLEADRAHVQKVAEFAKNNNLTQAQIKALNAETLFKEAETKALEYEIEQRAHEDDLGLMTNEAALTNSVLPVLSIEKSEFESFAPMERKSIIDAALVRVREEGNPNSEDIPAMQKLSDLYLNRGLIGMTDEEYAAYRQQQQQQQQQQQGFAPNIYEMKGAASLMGNSPRPL